MEGHQKLGGHQPPLPPWFLRLCIIAVVIILVTVLLESIDLLLLQLRVTRPKPMAQACRPTVYTYKTAYFNHVDISAFS